MAVLLDTSILYAYYDRSDAWHARALAIVHADADSLIVPAPVVPEVDHLLGHRLGAKARHFFYQGLVDGSYVIQDLAHDRYARVAELNRQFADLNLGFVDAAVAAIAEATQIKRVATADRRHFVPLAAALSLELLPVG